MIREKLMHQEAIDGFRWRNHEVTRIEGFSDAVFGFAVTLLIVSLEVPRTSTELLATMRGFGAFVITFIMLSGMWYAQFTFFRRYGLADRITVVLNLALLFTVLFFVYPLKFLFNVMMVSPTLKATIETAHGLEPVVLPAHRPIIFAIFGAGFSAVFLVFYLLYRHAYRQRVELELNEFEVFETRHSMRRQLLGVMIGISYFGTAWMQSLPHRTVAEKQRVETVGLVVAAVFLLFFAVLIRLLLQRRRVRKAWDQERKGGPSPADPPDEP